MKNRCRLTLQLLALSGFLVVPLPVLAQAPVQPPACLATPTPFQAIYAGDTAPGPGMVSIASADSFGVSSTYTVPGDASAILVIARGASGGSYGQAHRGNGGKADGEIAVSGGMKLTVLVGKHGGGSGSKGGRGYSGGGGGNGRDDVEGGGGSLATATATFTQLSTLGSAGRGFVTICVTRLSAAAASRLNPRGCCRGFPGRCRQPLGRTVRPVRAGGARAPRRNRGPAGRDGR